MADEHVPTPSPHSSAQITTPTGITPSSDGNITSAPDANGALPAENQAPSVQHGEWTMLGRWVLGALIVLVCGWGLIGLAVYLTRGYTNNLIMAFCLSALLDLGLFLILEKDFRLSRFMGLRIAPGARWWQSALWLWVGIPGLMFRATTFEAEAQARSSKMGQTRKQKSQQTDSVREIVETVVFVVVLVLLLKSFAAEAFVIPTGSMAQTLLGYQKEVVCPDCGIKFPINCSQEADPSDGGRPSPVYACVCPNCRQHIHFPSAPQGHKNGDPDSIEIPDPGWNSGDRVLVAKFVYDLLGRNPDRLDVVVFKYPGGSDFPISGPHRNHVPMNYIKRLIGLPGETIAIRGGKLYSLAAGQGLEYDDYEKAKQDPSMMATLWEKKPYMHVNAREALDRFNKGQFQIIRKKPENILSMMRLVYDNDHPSKNAPITANRWKSKAGWADGPPHGFRHENTEGGSIDWLRYHHLLRYDGGRRSLITDIMGYNTYQGGQHGIPLEGKNWVGDLILECEVNVESPQGEFRLELSKGIDRFQARWDLSTGTCSLFRVNSEGEQMLESKPTALKKKGSYRLRFANVDERLVVWVDGELPFDGGVTYAAPNSLGPREKNDFEPASIGVRGGGVTVQKMKLFRDTYYTTGGRSPDPDRFDPSLPDVPDVTATDPETWVELQHPPVLTLYVQPDHFLCLGDNSPESSDGRSWGAVPRRLLLGRALLVYYPFGRAGRIR